MREHPSEYGDNEFCSEIASIIKDYVSSLHLSATIAGADASPTGAFVGSVTDSTLSISGEVIESTLRTACIPTMTNELLAQAFSNALAGDVVMFTCTISGFTTTTSVPPVTVPSSDAGQVIAVFNSAPIYARLLALFEQQEVDYESANDEDFADVLADEVTKFYTQPISCSVTGMTHLAGSVGMGTIS